MKRQITTLAIATIVTVAAAGHCEAQLFGQRNYGGSISPRGGTSRVQADVGTVRGNERFLRGNRSRADFVGADIRDRGGFVGSVQATTPTTVQSMTTGIDVELGTTSSVNRPHPTPSATGMYNPRLTIAFDYPQPATNRKASSALAVRIESSKSLRKLGQIAVSIEDGTAILQGTVASERDRRLAQMLALFEPGIANVQNDLTVTSAKPQTVKKRSKRRKATSK